MIRGDDFTSTQCNKTIPSENNSCSPRYVGTFSSGPCPRLLNIRADTSKHEYCALRRVACARPSSAKALYYFGRSKSLNQSVWRSTPRLLFQRPILGQDGSDLHDPRR